jgi:hypothetical protein
MDAVGPHSAPQPPARARQRRRRPRPGAHWRRSLRLLLQRRLLGRGRGRGRGRGWALGAARAVPGRRTLMWPRLSPGRRSVWRMRRMRRRETWVGRGAGGRPRSWPARPARAGAPSPPPPPPSSPLQESPRPPAPTPVAAPPRRPSPPRPAARRKPVPTAPRPHNRLHLGDLGGVLLDVLLQLLDLAAQRRVERLRRLDRLARKQRGDERVVRLARLHRRGLRDAAAADADHGGGRVRACGGPRRRRGAGAGRRARRVRRAARAVRGGPAAAPLRPQLRIAGCLDGRAQHGDAARGPQARVVVRCLARGIASARRPAMRGAQVWPSGGPGPPESGRGGAGHPQPALG